MAKTNYLITDDNNHLNVTFFLDAGLFTITVDLLIQNYSPIELCNYINTLQIPNGFNATYNTNTFKILFSCNIDFQLDFRINNLYRIFGLEKKIYSSTNAKLYSNVINFNYPHYLNINIQNITQDIMMSNKDSLNINFIVPSIAYNYGDIIKYSKNEYDIKLFVKNYPINYLDILISDDYGLNFQNNSDFYFILEFDTD